MKMANSLLLGSAAGIVAVAGAQAADLPVKAKPVEYVKVCSLYGAGYYYIPGTDICTKIGGYVRFETFWNFGANGTTGPWVASTASGYNSGENSLTAGSADYLSRIRAYITAETRQQTQYGTLRTYLNVGVNVDSPSSGAGSLAQSAGGFNANRAFIQIAGFTIGKAASYYDFYSSPATSYFGPPSSDTGDGGANVMAYTAQFGNGLSGTLSFEDPRRAVVDNTAVAGALAGGNIFSPSATNAYGKIVAPDVVANLRIDQAWGAAQIMAAYHDVNPGYNSVAPAFTNHYTAQAGWAVGAGLKINTPFISPGDYFQTQVNYTQGALRYVATSLASSSAFARNGSSIGFGYASDAVFDSTNSPQLTTAWGVNAAFEHFWTPSVRTSLYGSYMKVSYNAMANTMLCNAVGGAGANAINGCSNNNYNWTTVGSRSQWNVTKDMYFGVDLLYMRLGTANSGATVTSAAVGTIPIGVYTVADQSIWAARFRAHRDIAP